jgi:hypothetical protein
VSSQWKSYGGRSLLAGSGTVPGDLGEVGPSYRPPFPAGGENWADLFGGDSEPGSASLAGLYRVRLGGSGAGLGSALGVVWHVVLRVLGEPRAHDEGGPMAGFGKSEPAVP